MFKRRITELFLRSMEHIEYGSIEVTTPDGNTCAYAGRLPGASARLILHDWGAVPAFAQDGDVGFAESYRDGLWESPDLAELFLFGLQNDAAMNRYIYGSLLGRTAARFGYLFARNTVKGSRKNIHSHYDLGNDFYALWLDPGMTYSSALFAAPDEELTTAQNRKYDRILRRLEANSGRLLEIGCGWGGFAERALEQGDFALKGVTISAKQHAYAAGRMQGKAVIAAEDYRSLTGMFDHIVSIEMFEAVGEAYWSVYFNKVTSLLAPKGKAVIQTITMRDDYFERYRAGSDAIRTFIFPGGMLPSPSRFKQECAKAGLVVTDEFAFGGDYARTLERWRTRFEARLPEVKALGFDEKFIRMWRFYLTSCIAAFKAGRTDVVQMELSHAT